MLTLKDAYDGLAKEAVLGPVVRIQQLTADEKAIFGWNWRCSGAVVPQTVPQMFFFVANVSTFLVPVFMEQMR